MTVIAWIVESSWPACVDAVRVYAPADADVVLLHVTGPEVPGAAHGAYAGLLGRGHPERDPGTALERLAAASAEQLLDCRSDTAGAPLHSAANALAGWNAKSWPPPTAPSCSSSPVTATAPTSGPAASAPPAASSSTTPPAPSCWSGRSPPRAGQPSRHRPRRVEQYQPDVSSGGGPCRFRRGHHHRRRKARREPSRWSQNLCSWVNSSITSKGFGDVWWGVDDDGDHEGVAGEFEKLVAVGFVVAVEAPDPAQHRGAAGGFPLPKLPDERAVEGLAVMPCRF